MQSRRLVSVRQRGGQSGDGVIRNRGGSLLFFFFFASRCFFVRKFRHLLLRPIPAHNLISSVSLSDVQTLVGLVQHILRRIRSLTDGGNSQTGGDFQLRKLQGLDGQPTAFGLHFRFVNRRGRHQDGELFPPVAADQIRFRDGLHYSGGYNSQNFVAGTVTVIVIDCLEVVDVHHHAGQRLILFPRLVPDGFEVTKETATVQTAGQSIARRQPFEFAVLFADLFRRRLQ